MKILITGASGFIGSFMVEEGLRRGDEVWAAVRATSSRRYLQDERIRLIELDFTRRKVLDAQLAHHKQEQGAWDVVIHCAGVTKCRNKQEFMEGNYTCTVNLVEALSDNGMMPKQFAYLSSLSVCGPVHEKNYASIREQDVPQPNTAYGCSKWEAEKWLHSFTEKGSGKPLPWVIFRPTGVYGPREKDYFLMVKSIKQHVDFEAGFKRQDLTFIYVKDLVKAVYLAIDKQVLHRVYLLSDGEVYSSRAFSDFIREELGNPFVLRIKCPLCVLRLISVVAEKLAALQGKASTLNRDKYNIMKQRNWRCDIIPAIKELDYDADYDLECGVRETIAWYKQEKWI